MRKKKNRQVNIRKHHECFPQCGTSTWRDLLKLIWPRVCSSPPLIHFSSIHSVCFWPVEPFQSKLKLNLDNPLVSELHALNSFRVKHEAIPHSEPPVGVQRGDDFKRSCRYLNCQLSSWTSSTKVVIYLNGSYWFEPRTLGAAQRAAVRGRARGKSPDEDARRGANDDWLDVWRRGGLNRGSDCKCPLKRADIV